MKTLSIAALALAATLTLPALADQKLLPAQSEVDFTSHQMGVPVEGKFKKFDASVVFDPKNPAAAKIGISIDLASVSLGAPESEAELVKPGWFDTAKFPKATFESTSVKATGPGKFDVTGKLSIKGAPHDVVVPITLTQAGGTTTAAGSFAIKRLAYKIGEGEWSDTSMVADDVQIKFKLALSGVPAL